MMKTIKKINEVQFCFLISVIAHIGLVGTGVLDLFFCKARENFLKLSIILRNSFLPKQYEIQEEKKIETQILEKRRNH